MRFSRNHLAACFLAVAAVCPAALLSQQSTPPADSATSPANSNSSQNPKTASANKPGPAAAAAPATPNATSAAAPDDNPFPEEQSLAAQKEATAAENSDREKASTGSVAGAGDSASSSRDKLAGMDLLGDRDSRVSDGAGGTIVDPKLSEQDIHVGQQYFGMGNYQGAYERFKEAVVVNPGNLDAVFYLAEAARKTSHLDESAQNYHLYLDAQPDGSKAKAARKALAQLEGK